MKCGCKSSSDQSASNDVVFIHFLLVIFFPLFIITRASCSSSAHAMLLFA